MDPLNLQLFCKDFKNEQNEIRRSENSVLQLSGLFYYL